MGLQLETQQYVLTGSGQQFTDDYGRRVLASDVAGTGLHPTPGQHRVMIERTSKLQRKIFAWIEVQHRFFPALANIRAREDERRTHLANGMPIPGITVPNIALWLPSTVCTAAGRDKLEIAVRASVFTREYRLRVSQASEALHDLCRGLLVRTHLYQLKDDYSRGVRTNMRSGDKITALSDQIKRAAGAYQVARKALVGLGQEVGRDEWEWTLQHLSEEDVRGLLQARFHDPDWKKKKKKSKRARKDPWPLSWIWVNKGERWDPGDDVAMNEGTRICFKQRSSI
jgi:hypothetical protein